MSNDKNKPLPPKVVREFLRRSDVNAKAAGLEETTMFIKQVNVGGQILWKILCNYESDNIIYVFCPVFVRWYYQKLYGEFSWIDQHDAERFHFVGGQICERMQGGTTEAFANADCMYTG